MRRFWAAAALLALLLAGSLANADLMAQLALIAEMEQPSWINVL